MVDFFQQNGNIVSDLLRECEFGTKYIFKISGGKSRNTLDPANSAAYTDCRTYFIGQVSANRQRKYINHKIVPKPYFRPPQSLLELQRLQKQYLGSKYRRDLFMVGRRMRRKTRERIYKITKWYRCDCQMVRNKLLSNAVRQHFNLTTSTV